MDNLMENLNAEQLSAVMHKKGPLLIVAGAGTGKTTVITQRVAYLIEQGLAKPEEILALTFTEKAAGEMSERVDRLLPLGYLDLWISTFHSFCERILSLHGLDIGLPAGARLLNEFEQYALVKKNFDKFELDYYRPLGNPNKFIHALIKHFSRCKDEDVGPEQYLKYAGELKENSDEILSGKKITNYKLQITNFSDGKGKPDKELLSQEISRINEVANAYHVYQQLLLENESMDFGDLINYALRLFRERPAILEKYRRQFKHILLDEFQDTNWAQYELVKLLAAPKNNLTVVGDDDQSIYKFRGASLSNILQFKKDYPQSKEIVLVKNYRNRQNILDLAYNFIQLNNPNRLEYVLKNQNAENRKQKELNKKLSAQNKGEGEIKVLEGKDLGEEMRLVAEKIADLKIESKRGAANDAHANGGEEEAGWNDFGILVRANESAKEMCATLDAAGLPYQFLASRGLYSKPVIMDLAAYLKLLDNYHESAAVYRILNFSIFEFNASEIANFNFIAKKKAWSLYTVLKDAKGRLGADTQKKIETVLNLIAKHSALAREKTASEVVMAFLHDSGYLKSIMQKEDRIKTEEIAYLNKFMRRLQEFEAGSDDKSVRAFLDEFNLELESGSEGVIAPDAEAGPEAIKLMTVHGAKGLEFKYVFVLNMVDLRFPTIERKEPIQLPDDLVKEILPEGDIHLEEERRLFYVAITRAKNNIYFSWAPDYGGSRRKKPSRFLAEAGLITDSKKAPGKEDKKEKGRINFDINKFGNLDKGGSRARSLPSYYSYTQLAAFNNCPYQYQLAHIIKVPRQSKHTLSFGQTMHLCLQRIFEQVREIKNFGQANLFGEANPADSGRSKISWDEIKKIYAAAWIDEWYESDKQKQEYKKLGEKSLKEFYEKHKNDWPNAISLEQGINLKISGFRIFGKIDRVDEIDGGIQIVDYKTGAPKNKAKISAEDKEQLLIYQLAVEQAFEKKIANLQFYYLNDNSEINFIGSDKELRDMEGKILSRIEKIIKAVESNNFPAKPGPLCKFCDYAGICEYRKI